MYIYVYIYTYQRMKHWQVQSYAFLAPYTYSPSFVGWHHSIGCQPPAFLTCFQPIR